MKFKIQNLEFRIISTAALYLLAAVSACSHLDAAKKVVWHQNYEPIETQQVYDFVNEAFSEAVRLYGPPAIPVQEIHIRQSIPRTRPARLARADILSWSRLAEVLYSGRNKVPMSRIWEDFDEVARALIARAARAEELRLGEKLLIVQELNAIVEGEELYDPVSFASIKVPWWRRVMSHERLNRSILEELFPGTFVPVQRWRRIPVGFQLCEPSDISSGQFIIYVSVTPEDPEFYLQLAHEVCHLLNPHVYDWYMEGLCTVFAKHMAHKTGHTWEPWEKRFNSCSDNDPYAIAYHMMQEVCDAAAEYMKEFSSFTKWRQNNSSHRRVDIDAWLAQVSEEARHKVLDIIRRHGPKLERHKGRQNAFSLSELLH